MNREPAAVMAAIQAILALFVSFGLDITPEQIGMILAVVAAIFGLIVRSRVSPAVSSPAHQGA